ncbi:hypothetical protein GCM10007424_04890 [Flavobacterium suaedae]|uniref:Alpha/beta hydrolase n=1 Tax=Flavobacterium suaedae TaxID=1767027 RepID=A0ABQ1JJI4_9FLAO|nr:alpha/beta hydrolase-fold protein [Flavobacterium suaedae]GGB67926.1 hypothetical protein GCM10007424_04890 [Flavobacterium suaedae]
MKTKKPLGNVTSFVLEAPQLHSDKTIWVYLPYNYNNSDTNYPVLYMHDGQNVFDESESYKREWHVEDKLNELHSEVIVVGIEHGGSTHRIDELTPYKNDDYGGGHADDYLDFMLTVLKPHIDNNFRTLTDKEHTTIFGSSVGGLISFYALLKFPDVFGNAGVFSPSFWFSEEIFKLMDEVETIEGKIYFMAGDHESKGMIPDLERMEKLVLQKVKNENQVYKKIVPNGRHNEKSWRKQFKEAYMWLEKQN